MKGFVELIIKKTLKIQIMKRRKEKKTFFQNFVDKSFIKNNLFTLRQRVYIKYFWMTKLDSNPWEIRK